MEQNDIVKIRNCAGLLDVKLLRKLDNRDCFRGFEESLDFSGRLRWEFHKQKGGAYMITLCERNENNKKIIVAFLDYEELEMWEAEYLGTEKDEHIYTLMEEY